MCKNKLALSLAYLLAAFHLIWALIVWLMPAQLQRCLDWIFNLHGIEPVWIITQMTLVNAIILVIVTFVAGYILGWVLAWLLECYDNKNSTKKKK